jgi:hypothetical protein
MGMAIKLFDQLIKCYTGIAANLLVTGIDHCTLLLCVMVPTHLKFRSEQKKCIYKQSSDLQHIGDTKKAAAVTPLYSKWWNGRDGYSHGNVKQ